MDDTNLVFNKAAQKVIKDAFKHAAAYLLPPTTHR
jgi:hypothetical protein